MAESQSDVHKVVRCIVTVHGIGEQRENETVLEPIYRFAKARRLGADIANPLSLGQLSGLSDENTWIAFDGIPVEPPRKGSSAEMKLRAQTFFGRPESEPGQNLRFVDLYWADIMQDKFGEVGVPLKTWAQSLLNRIRAQSVPRWAVDLMENMKHGLLPLQFILKSRLPVVSDVIFNRFLGDVQLYGESGTIRGQAVRRFHDTMERVHRAHLQEDIEPRYTIIAHSLGSIMSLDALMFAHARQDKKTVARSEDGGARAGISRFLKGYTAKSEPEQLPEKAAKNAPNERQELAQAGAEAPATDWVKNVDAFVTLGSPIDKFIVLWPLNYEYLLNDDWMDTKLKNFRSKAENKIRHFNYCDEQDPVGHQLDTAYEPEKKAVATVFGEKPVEDRVFNRYWLPGVAHLNYWTDDDLFRRILDTAVDQKDPQRAHRVRWFDSRVYLKLLLVSYVGMPAICWIVCSFAACWFWFAGSWRTGAVALIVTVILAFFAAKIMGLLIKWRRLMIIKRKSYQTECHREFKGRRWLGRTVRAMVYVAPFFWTGALIFAYWGLWQFENCKWDWLTPRFARAMIAPSKDIEWQAQVWISGGIAIFVALTISCYIRIVYYLAKRRFRVPP